MTFTIIECDQRTDEWHQARLGRLTGSRAADILATTKGGKESASRRNLRAQLVLERIMERPMEGGYVSFAMQQGIDREPDAQLLYEVLTGRMLQQTGFLSTDGLAVGSSLDGHVGDFEGIVECKCPMPTTHLDYIKTGRVPTDYMAQLTHNLWVSGARWADWLSYNPDFPEPLRAKLLRVERDETVISLYAKEAQRFLAEVDAEEAAVRRLAEVVA
jgi:hypothetical protein